MKAKVETRSTQLFAENQSPISTCCNWCLNF